MKPIDKASFSQLIIDIIISIKNPKSVVREDISKLSRTIVTLGKILMVKFVFSLLIVVFVKLFNLGDNKVFSELRENFPPHLFFIFFVIISPIVEESIFRLPLKYKSRNLAAATFFFLFCFVFPLILVSSYMDMNSTTLYIVFISVSLSWIIYLIVNKHEKAIKQFYIERYKFIYILSIVVFGLAHIVNFDFKWTTLYFFPILIAPHILGGAVFSYIRIKFGFLYCCLFHCFNNLIVFIIAP